MKTTQRPIRVQLPPAVLKSKTALARAAKDIPIANLPLPNLEEELRKANQKGLPSLGQKRRTFQKKIKETVALQYQPIEQVASREIQRVFQTQFRCCFSQKILSENKRLGNFRIKIVEEGPPCRLRNKKEKNLISNGQVFLTKRKAPPS